MSSSSWHTHSTDRGSTGSVIKAWEVVTASNVSALSDTCEWQGTVRGLDTRTAQALRLQACQILALACGDKVTLQVRLCPHGASSKPSIWFSQILRKGLVQRDGLSYAMLNKRYSPIKPSAKIACPISLGEIWDRKPTFFSDLLICLLLVGRSTAVASWVHILLVFVGTTFLACPPQLASLATGPWMPHLVL